jgi:hypothetical protein
MDTDADHAIKELQVASTPLELLDHFADREYAAAYLAGMIDGEGTVPRASKRSNKVEIRIVNTDPTLILACRACCETLELRYRIARLNSPSKRKPHLQPIWSFSISSRSSLQRVADQVPILAAHKRKNLQDALKTFKRPPYALEPTKDVLTQLYLVEKKTFNEICCITGARSHAAIVYWIKKHGIALNRKARKEGVLRAHALQA